VITLVLPLPSGCILHCCLHHNPPSQGERPSLEQADARDVASYVEIIATGRPAGAAQDLRASPVRPLDSLSTAWSSGSISGLTSPPDRGDRRDAAIGQ
jgi:hypothetical protein